MSPEAFDRLFKQRLYDMETDVPEHLWSGIAGQIAPRKKRRYGLWLLLLAPVLTLSSWYTYTALYTPETSFSASGQQVSESAPQLSNTFGLDEAKQLPPPTTSMATLPAIGKERPVASDHPSTLPISEQRIEPRNIGGLTTKKTKESHHQIPHQMPGISLRSPVDVQALTSQDPKIDICPTFNTQRTGIRPFFELAVDAGLPFRSLQATEPNFTDYADLRNRTEQERSVFGLQALLGLEIGNHFELKAGIGLRQTRELFDYFDEDATRTIVNIITDTINVNGQTIITTDTSVITQYGQRIKRTHNLLTFVDLPVMASYVYRWGEDHRLKVGAGATLNLAFWQRGDILAPDESIISLAQANNDNNGTFRSTTGLDLMAYLGYERSLNDRQSLMIRLAYRQTMEPVTFPDYPLQQKYSQITLGLGWKYRL